MKLDIAACRGCVCATLRMAARAVTQHYDNTLRPSGLRATQFNILAAIYGAGEASITRLTKALTMDQTTLTRSLALLKRRGLLETTPQADGRVKSFRLTAKGKKKLELAYPLWAGAQERVMAEIGGAEWAKLQRELRRLLPKEEE